MGPALSELFKVLMEGGNSGAAVRAAGPQWEMGDTFLWPFLPSGGWTEKEPCMCGQRMSPAISVNKGR